VKKDTPTPGVAKADKAEAKLVYRVDEVAKISGLESDLIDAWEQEYPFLNAGRTGGGRKFYRRKDIEIILRIKELTASKKLTAAGIRRQIEEEFGLVPPTPVHPEKLRKALYNVRDELREIASGLDRKAKKK